MTFNSLFRLSLNMRLLTTIIVTITLLKETNAFLLIPSNAGSKRRSIPVRLAAASWNEYEKTLTHNRARTDVCNFLTQRSLQSFIYLLLEARDPHTVKWMEGFGGWKNLEHFHGTGALNLTRHSAWDSVLLEMMRQPPDAIIVQEKGNRRPPGGSRNNPYLQDQPVREYQVDIEPTSLVSRILSVREQLAGEFVDDLDLFISANEQILDSYRDRAMNDRDTEEGSFLDSKQKTAYDRNAMALGDFGLFNDDKAPSPLRKANFDLLALLVTQESVHRVLWLYRNADDENKKVAFEWLREFYSDRVEKYFDGNGGFARADDFLDELLRAPPSVKLDTSGHTSKTASPNLLDTLRIAKDVIRMRAYVAFIFQARISNTQKDHTDIRKTILSEQWANTHQEVKTDPEYTDSDFYPASEFE